MSPMRRLIDRESRQVLFMGMETAWLALGLLVVDGAIGDESVRAGLVWLCLNYYPAYVLARLAEGWGTRRIWRIIGLVLAATALIAVEAYFLVAAYTSDSTSTWIIEALGAGDRWKYGLAAIVCGGFVWARGWFLSGRKVDTGALAGGFQFGLGVMIVCLMLAWLGKMNASGFITALCLFFAIGLSGIAWSRRLDSVNRSRNALNGPWTWAMPVSVIVVLAVGVLVYLFFDRELVQIILQPVFKLWDALVELVNWIMSLLPKPGQMAPPEMAPPPPPPPAPDVFKSIREGLKWLKPVGNVMFAGGSAALVMGALFRVLVDILRFLRKKMNPGEAILVERLEYGFWDDLKLVIYGIFGLPLKLARWLAVKFRLKTETRSDFYRMSAIYTKFLVWGSGIGVPKNLGETPDEYALRLASVLDAEGGSRLRALTDAFMRFRYGPDIPESSDVSTMKTDFRGVKRGLLKKKERPEAPVTTLVESRA